NIEWIELAALGLNLVLVGVYVLVIRARSVAAGFSARMLMRGRLGRVFLLGAVGTGLVAPIALAGAAVATGSPTLRAVAACTERAGDHHRPALARLLRERVHGLRAARDGAELGQRLVPSLEDGEAEAAGLEHRGEAARRVRERDQHLRRTRRDRAARADRQPPQ